MARARGFGVWERGNGSTRGGGRALLPSDQRHHRLSDALDILRQASVDLVVTDQAIPRMTRLQLMQTIASEWPRLPTILVSGYAELASDAYPGLIRLGKPFRQEQLTRAIAEALRASAAG